MSRRKYTQIESRCHSTSELKACNLQRSFKRVSRSGTGATHAPFRRIDPPRLPTILPAPSSSLPRHSPFPLSGISPKRTGASVKKEAPANPPARRTHEEDSPRDDAPGHRGTIAPRRFHAPPHGRRSGRRRSSPIFRREIPRTPSLAPSPASPRRPRSHASIIPRSPIRTMMPRRLPCTLPSPSFISSSNDPPPTTYSGNPLSSILYPPSSALQTLPPPSPLTRNRARSRGSSDPPSCPPRRSGGRSRRSACRRRPSRRCSRSASAGSSARSLRRSP